MLSRFKELYTRYVARRMTSDEFHELKATAEQLPDQTLWSVMLANEGTGISMPGQMKKQVARELHRAAIMLPLRQMAGYVAACLLTAAICAGVFLFFGGNDLATNPEFTASVAPGSRTTLTLPDGSTVQLNSASEITYTEEADGTRNVTLRGEAYFDVAKDPERPFTVSTSNLHVRVVGTTFNVNAYNSDCITTTLLTGKVSLSSDDMGEKAYTLTPGNKATYNKLTRSMEISATDTASETAWLDDYLIFDNETLSHVIAKIERRYGLKIELRRPDLADDRISGKFHSENLNNVIASLCVMYGFEYKLENNLLILY